ncbi:hypothetical protein RAE19_09205 [Rhodoferax sp. TBRC 17660]|uniref:EF-hand domain-containing protein n=1 Tax=Rhodoferax potami TaxID=3068338 RepID=A0ABU3KN23_9BURK|nr:hypothetical protein [Rhodoferax sp. TBRC 17660]MDT7518883.1 hypothetical protein [Rhodoferax sp. TBRC 17660]
MDLGLTGLRWVRSQSLNGLLAAAYSGAAGAAFHFGPGRAQLWCVGAASAIGLMAWGASLRRARAIANIATSRIASAAQGYVELQGRTSTTDLIYSPLTHSACIWYRYRIYERNNSKDEWREVDSGVSSATFDLLDGSGSCTIDPDHAEVMGAEVVTRYANEHKHVEELLHGGRTLYALGEFITIGGANSALSLREDVNALLTTWKQNPTDLHRRFDLNRDGEIDLQEWELARRLAVRTVEHEHRNIRAQPGVHMLRAPQDGRLFLLSPLSPQALRRRYLLWSALHLSVCLGAAYVALKLLLKA